MFLNGVLDGTSVGSAGPLDANAMIAFGGNALDQRYFDGMLDDIQFYNRVLTPAEVLAIYQSRP